ncbi:glycosyltransferase [Clostridium perfringens]|uniref:glycosyltransferase n=1 Tax=Clostridium perfringens TaxID=1502 RepID=UPI002A3432DA|nr:glycosyltransferase family 2 protein [Clostridium perfringens]
MKKTTLIVLNYNDYETTSSFLEQIKSYDNIENIIVVDNNSSDNSFEVLSKFKSCKIDVIKSNENGGYGKGNNIGLIYAEKKYKPKYYIISNPDIKINQLTIQSILDYLENNDDVAMCTAKMIEKNGEINKRFAWKLPTYKDNIILCFPILSKLIKPTIYKKELLKSNAALYVDVVPGSFFVIKSQVFKDVDYFDECTFLFYEEEILAYKIKNKGYKIALLSDKEFIHNHGVTINKHYRKYLSRYNIMGKSKVIYLKKYLKVGRFKLLIFRVLYNISKIEIIILEFLKSFLKKR